LAVLEFLGAAANQALMGMPVFRALKPVSAT